MARQCQGLRKRMVACSAAGDEAAVCSELGIENGSVL
jgi:hypothetical protein